MATPKQEEPEYREALRVLYFAIICCVAILRVIQGLHRDSQEKEFQARLVENGKFIDQTKQYPFSDWPKIHTGFAPMPNIRKETVEILGSAQLFIGNFLTKIRAHNLTAAYDMTSASFRKRVSAEEFADLIGDHPEIKQADQCQVWGNIRYPNGSACLQLHGSATAAAKTVVHIGASKETNWAIDEFKVEATEN